MLSTKNVTVGSSGPSKTLLPGNVVAKINKVELKSSNLKPGAYDVILNLEGVEQPEPFEGFFIDKDNPDAGRYKGQIARVRTSDWPYSDGVIKSTGTQIYRDIEIMKTIKQLCIALNAEQWFDDQDDKHNTIEEFIDAFNADAPYKDVWFEFCIAGREYINKQGYPTFDLYLPKFSKGKIPYEIADTASGKLIEFDPTVHLKKSEVKTVENFGDEAEQKPAAKPVSKDFEL